MLYQFRKIHKKPPVPEPHFYQSYMEKRLQNSCFPVYFAKLLRRFFYRTPAGHSLCSTWREVVRDATTLFLMGNFK